LRGRDNVGALAEFDVADAGRCAADFEDATIVMATIVTAAASMIVMPGARGAPAPASLAS
jgi:hypothetical protein